MWREGTLTHQDSGEAPSPMILSCSSTVTSVTSMLQPSSAKGAVAEELEPPELGAKLAFKVSIAELRRLRPTEHKRTSATCTSTACASSPLEAAKGAASPRCCTVRPPVTRSMSAAGQPPVRHCSTRDVSESAARSTPGRNSPVPSIPDGADRSSSASRQSCCSFERGARWSLLTRKSASSSPTSPPPGWSADGSTASQSRIEPMEIMERARRPPRLRANHRSRLASAASASFWPAMPKASCTSCIEESAASSVSDMKLRAWLRRLRSASASSSLAAVEVAHKESSSFSTIGG
mmetsp:Transcript_39897/g.114955  ORF Transcript_39897/g.114955 Transcript_39897/m.114955 type:complete len:293 (+) Transcript_39897:631-1509(+)